jgi:hypothetical protein
MGKREAESKGITEKYTVTYCVHNECLQRLNDTSCILYVHNNYCRMNIVDNLRCV